MNHILLWKMEGERMIQSIYAFAAAVLAWMIACACFQLFSGKAALHATLGGLLCGGICYLLQTAKLSELSLMAVTALFGLWAVLAKLWLRCGWGNALHLFLLAQSAFCVFWLPGRAINVIPLPAIIIGAAVAVVFIALAVCLRDRFPESDWREAFESDKKTEHTGPRWRQMYLVPTAVWLLLTAACRLLRPETIPGCAALSLLGGVVFWFGVWLMLLMNDYQKERATVQTEQQYRSEMQSFLNVIRSQRHDYNFHVQTIAGLIRQGKVEDCLRYVDALEEDTAIMNAVLPVRDPAISALIHNFRLMAVRQGIELHVDIHYDLSQIATNVYETNKIISNLLQNAIDEVSTHEDKSYGIWLTILKRGEYCVIRVSNKIRVKPSEEELGNIYRQGYTTKAGHDGVGLSSLRTLVGRYKGAIYTQVEDDVIQFVARVPINYAKEPITE